MARPPRAAAGAGVRPPRRPSERIRPCLPAPPIGAGRFGPGGHQRNPEWRLDEPANRANNPARYDYSVGVVTALSQAARDAGRRRATTLDSCTRSQGIAVTTGNTLGQLHADCKSVGVCLPRFESRTCRRGQRGYDVVTRVLAIATLAQIVTLRLPQLARSWSSIRAGASAAARAGASNRRGLWHPWA